jgi:hypothetical protein
MTREQLLLEVLTAVGIRLYKTKIEELTKQLIEENNNLINVLTELAKEVRDDDHHKTATR